MTLGTLGVGSGRSISPRRRGGGGSSSSSSSFFSFFFGGGSGRRQSDRAGGGRHRGSRSSRGHSRVPPKHAVVLRVAALSSLLLLYLWALTRYPQPDGGTGTNSSASSASSSAALAYRGYEHVAAWNAALEARTQAILRQEREDLETIKRIRRQRPFEPDIVEEVEDAERAAVDSSVVQQQLQRAKATGNATILSSDNSSNSTTTNEREKKNKKARETPEEEFLRLMSIVLVMSTCSTLIQLYVRSVFSQRQGNGGNGGTTTSNATTARRQNRILERERDRLRGTLLESINRQRRAAGQPPLRPESLSLAGLVVAGGGGAAAAGAASDSSSVPGATQQEIDRCPTRILRPGDELLSPQQPETETQTTTATNSSSSIEEQPLLQPIGTERRQQQQQICAVCLQRYEPGDEVRTIPCFHAYHRRCIDPWLLEKAECPLCKHPLTVR